MEKKNYLTVKETAKYLNRSESNIYDMLNKDEFR